VLAAALLALVKNRVYPEYFKSKLPDLCSIYGIFKEKPLLLANACK
jgi:hypothetical protein